MRIGPILAVFPFDQWWFWTAAAGFSIAVGVAVFLLARPKKPVLRPIEDGAIQTFIRHLGGIDNLTDAAKDGARLRFGVRSVEACDLNALRDDGAMGVFVSGNNIKFMLTSDADRLVETVRSAKRGEAQ
jgi:phosphotransferase system IIB component